VRKDPLVDIHDQFFDFKIPLKALSADPPASIKLEIANANWPNGMIEPYAVTPYGR